MASTFNISAAAASAQCDALATRLNGGTLTIYTGPQPASVALGIGSVTALAHREAAEPVLPDAPPRAPDAIEGRPSAWALEAPRLRGHGRVIAPVSGRSRIALPVSAWRPGAGTVDQTAGVEEEAFLLGFLLGGD
jgi:hypothetical protein